MTRRLKCRIDPEQSPYTCMLPEHKPVRRGREMIDLLAVEEPKPKPAKIRAVRPGPGHSHGATIAAWPGRVR